MAALLLDLAGPYVWRRGVDQITVAPSHAAERCGLFVILALEESIIASGVGASGSTLDFGTISAMSAALVVSAAM